MFFFEKKNQKTFALGSYAQRSRQPVGSPKQQNARTLPDARRFGHDLSRFAIGLQDAVVQRVQIETEITGVTHLVALAGNTLLGGAEERQLTAGQTVLIDTADRKRSRRGPNQELFRFGDRQTGRHDFTWFRVIAVDGKKIGGQLYIRHQTFVPARPLTSEELQATGGVLEPDSDLRGRAQPTELDSYTLATSIVRDMEATPLPPEVTTAVASWQSKLPPPQRHDATGSLRLIRVAAAIARNQAIAQLVAEGRSDALWAVIRLLNQSQTRQIIQELTDPKQNVALLAQALTNFTTRVQEMLGSQAGRKKLALYFRETLDHDKGYAQTLKATKTEVQEDSTSSQAPDFATMLSLTLYDSSNTHVWGHGQEASSIAEQLPYVHQRRGKEEKSSTDGTSEQPALAEGAEARMWEKIIVSLFNMYGKQWPLNAERMEAVCRAIKQHEGLLFDTVQSLVGTGVLVLSREKLIKAREDNEDNLLGDTLKD